MRPMKCNMPTQCDMHRNMPMDAIQKDRCTAIYFYFYVFEFGVEFKCLLHFSPFLTSKDRPLLKGDRSTGGKRKGIQHEENKARKHPILPHYR